MTPGQTLRKIEAAQKRQQREAKKKQRDLERLAKEMAKLSAQEKARLEVDTYENSIEVLLSIHKEQAAPTDWLSIMASLPPFPPARFSHNELRARRRALLCAETNGVPSVEEAKRQDEMAFADAVRTYEGELAEWQKLTGLARRILGGDTTAYITAIQEMSPFAELAGIGSSLHFTVHSPRIVEVVLNTKGKQAIPAEVKTLTTSGKVSVKSMPRARFVEIYQDYVCGCVLRVARELFALLPIETLLITATAEALDGSTGQASERPFLSVSIPRTTLNSLNFDHLDPSDAIMGMIHRGELKASRKTGDFEFIAPLTIEDIPAHERPAHATVEDVLSAAKTLRADLAKRCDALNPAGAVNVVEAGETQ